MKNTLFVFFLLSIAFVACKEKDEGCDNTINTTVSDQEQLGKDIGYIDDFLSQNGITAIEDESGVRYVIHKQGEGLTPGVCNSVLVNYSGHILNRTSIFDAGDTVGLGLKNVIVGWQVGFTNLPKGSSATLYIPSGLAYGSRGSGTIPGNANLVFDVDLIDIN